MNPFLLYVLPVLAFLKDSLSEFFKTKAAKYMLVAAVVYFTFKKWQQQALLKQTGTDSEGVLASRLHAAFHPFIELPFGLPDGTDETAVKQIAAAIGKAGNYGEVYSAYNRLYGKDLTRELQSEGVYPEFINALNGSTEIRSGDFVTAKPLWPVRSVSTGKTIDWGGGGEKYWVYDILLNTELNGRTADWATLRKYPNETIFYANLRGLRPA